MCKKVGLASQFRNGRPRAKRGGNVDYPRNLEAGKLGLWPDRFFKTSADTGFGNNAFRDSGAIMPANTDRPRAGQSTGLIDLRDT
jgi:hypothetical protein